MDYRFKPVSPFSEALQDPQARHLQLEVSAVHPRMGEFRTVRSPVSFDGERSLEVKPPPVLGEHNEEVLGVLKNKPAAQAGARKY